MVWGEEEMNTQSKTFVLEEKHGDLPYMVTWLSADGRPIIKYFGTLEGAEKQRDWLITLQRQPEIWLRISSTKEST